jgi:hypothetical protein
MEPGRPKRTAGDQPHVALIIETSRRNVRYLVAKPEFPTVERQATIIICHRTVSFGSLSSQTFWQQGKVERLSS